MSSGSMIWEFLGSFEMRQWCLWNRDECGARSWMSDLENMIEAVKQGDLERVRAILESDDRLANQKNESGATPLTM